MSAIQLRGVAKQYPPREPGLGPQDLLRAVDLEVHRGEFVAVEGQSGSGKSTLLHILGGLDREFAGEARVLGCDLRGVSDAELAALRSPARWSLARRCCSPTSRRETSMPGPARE